MIKLNEINEPYECVMLLDDINKVIDTLYALQDEGYYMDYIFNRGALTEDLLNDIGITEQYIQETTDKFEKLRIALYGDCIDWKNLVQHELRTVAMHERKQNRINQDRIMKLEYDNKRMKEREK